MNFTWNSLMFALIGPQTKSVDIYSFPDFSVLPVIYTESIFSLKLSYWVSLSSTRLDFEAVAIEIISSPIPLTRPPSTYLQTWEAVLSTWTNSRTKSHRENKVLTFFSGPWMKRMSHKLRMNLCLIRTDNGCFHSTDWINNESEKIYLVG